MPRAFIDTKLTALAYVIACAAHRGQKDKAGEPYIKHPLHIAAQMKDEESAAVALLHDVLEDTSYTALDLLEAGIPEQIISKVEILTRKKGETYFEYIERVKQDPVATTVKLADLEHNSDLSRLPCVTYQDQSRLKRYKKAIFILTS